MQHDKAITTINNLIETCKDGEKGFREAAEGLKSPDIKAKFLQYSQQRAEMSRELQTLVRGMGGDPETSGSMSASLHRGWIDLKAALTGRDEAAILAEAERGEDVAKNAYENALKEALPPDAQMVVQQQAMHVQQAHDNVKHLRDSRKSSV